LISNFDARYLSTDYDGEGRFSVGFISLVLFAKRFQTFFQKKKIFCGSIGTDLSICLVRVGVRSCTSRSPHTPFKRELLGVVVVVVVL